MSLHSTHRSAKAENNRRRSTHSRTAPNQRTSFIAAAIVLLLVVGTQTGLAPDTGIAIHIGGNTQIPEDLLWDLVGNTVYDGPAANGVVLLVLSGRQILDSAGNILCERQGHTLVDSTSGQVLLTVLGARVYPGQVEPPPGTPALLYEGNQVKDGSAQWTLATATGSIQGSSIMKRLVAGALIFGECGSDGLAGVLFGEPGATLEDVLEVLSIANDVIGAPVEDLSDQVQVPDPKGPSGFLPILEIQAVIADLEGLVGGALAPLNAAIDEYTAPPDREAAVGNLADAIGHIAVAVAAGELDPVVGDELMDRLAGTARTSAVEALEAAIARDDDPDLIEEALADLAEGDLLRSEGFYQAATMKYGEMLVHASLFFHLPTFQLNIKNAFDGNVLGYAYVIGKDGFFEASFADGPARRAIDEPQRDMSRRERMMVASVSKTVTAVTLLKVLQDQVPSVSVGDSILPYLPSEWDADSSIGSLTFKELMTHTSGLNSASNASSGFNSLRQYIEDGTGTKSYQYENGNYGLFRIIIPYLRMDVEGLAFWFHWTTEEATAILYQWIVNVEVLNPMGITGTGCKPLEPDPLLAYAFDNPSNGSLGRDAYADNGNYSLVSGAYGWYLSAFDLAAFLAHVRYGDILAPATRTLMDDNFLGWNDPCEWDWSVGSYGIYRNHGGDHRFYDPDNLPDPGQRQEVHACIMNYPNNVQVSLIFNSAKTFSVHQCQKLRNAFDKAWLESVWI